jgi:hypothetical protein
MSWCYPPKSRCEWKSLRRFVEHYNKAYGRDYGLKRCLDVQNRQRKEPEVLLEDGRRSRMVIERKCICWPRDYVRWHSKEHLVYEEIRKRMAEAFDDGLYLLELHAKDLQCNDRAIREIATEIAGAIVANTDEAKQRRGIDSDTPIPWTFRPLPKGWCDEDARDVGVGVWISEDPPWNDPDEFHSAEDRARSEISADLSCAFEQCSSKFAGYEDCLKVVVLEFYGHVPDLLEDEEVVALVSQAKRPSIIDQIWIGRPEYVSEIDWEVVYERVARLLWGV